MNGRNGSCPHDTPPLFQSRERAGFSGFPARVFLLVLVLAAGVSSLAPGASAQSTNTFRFGSGLITITGVSTSFALRDTVSSQSITIAAQAGFNWNFSQVYACTKTATPTSSAIAYVSSGCVSIVSRPGDRGSLTRSISVTQAMINNRGVVIVVTSAVGPANIHLGQWVPIRATLLLSRSTALPVTEGSTATYTVSLSTQPTGGVRVKVASDNTKVKVKTGSGSPSSSVNLDFTQSDWNTAQTVTVSADEDDTDAIDDTATLTHTTVDANTVAEYDAVSGPNLTVNVTDNDYAGLSIADAEASESAGTLDFTVTKSLESSRTVTVDWTLAAGTATAGTDYDNTMPSGMLAFSAGETSKTISVPINDDSLVEGDETVTVTLSNQSPSEVTISDSSATGTIKDDDLSTLSTLSISGGGEVTEGDSGSSVQAAFTVSLAPARSREVSVSYATADGTAEAGSDYVAASGTVTFSSGETSKTVVVTVNGDDEAEANETFSVTLTASSNGQIDSRNSSAEAVIVNDDTTVDASMSGEFSVGDTTVTVDSTLPADTGLEVVLPSELESGGAMIEELTVTLGPTDEEIDADLFGYTGTDDDHVLVDIDVSPVPDGAVRICLPVTDGLRRAAGEQRLYLIRFSGGSWEELSSTTEGDKVCADVNGFAPFALVYQTDYVKRRFGEVNRAILPELSRAMTASALDAITGRIDDAMAGGTTAAFNVPSPSGEAEYGEPGLRLGELEDGETLSLLDSVDGSYFSVSPAGSYDSAVGGTALAAAERGEEDSAPGAGDVSAPRSGGLGMWISGDYRNLSGKSGGLVDWDGRLVSGHLGADYRFGRSFLAGVATSWSQGSFDYTGRGESGRVSGDYGSRMNSFHPYLGLSLSRRLDVWAAGGWGFGEIRIDDGEVSGRRRASTRLGTLATGADLQLLGSGATTLSLKGEAWISRMKVKDNGGRIEGLRVGTNRLRATLEGSHALAFGSGSSLVPSLEFGIRRDGGDGETGVGGELGGGIAYASSFGLAVEARGRALLFHQGDTGEWGLGGSVRFDPGEDGRGLSMSVLPSYGNSASGVQGLWESETAEGGSSGSERELGLETEVGYGFAAPGARGLLTPYGAFGRSGGDGRSYGVGSRFSMGGTFDIALEGRRRELSAGEPEHELTLQGRLNW